MAGCRAICRGWTENKELQMDKENGKNEQIPRVVIANSKQDVKKIDVRDLDV